MLSVSSLRARCSFFQRRLVSVWGMLTHRGCLEPGCWAVGRWTVDGTVQEILGRGVARADWSVKWAGGTCTCLWLGDGRVARAGRTRNRTHVANVTSDDGRSPVRQSQSARQARIAAGRECQTRKARNQTVLTERRSVVRYIQIQLQESVIQWKATRDQSGNWIPLPAL